MSDDANQLLCSRPRAKHLRAPSSHPTPRKPVPAPEQKQVNKQAKVVSEYQVEGEDMGKNDRNVHNWKYSQQKTKTRNIKGETRKKGFFNKMVFLKRNFGLVCGSVR